jgi:hypothetical protein
VIEVATRKTFPLSVFTFLTLVESGFYTEMDIVSGGSDVLLLVGTSGKDVASMDAKLRALGFLGGSTLYFPESSPEYLCGPNSLGFVDRGPALHFFASSGAGEGDQSCFAEIVRGTDTLDLVHQSLSKGETIRLSSATVLLATEEIESSPDL